MTIRVVFGEDNYLAREGILRALEDEDDIDVVATCGDFDSLRRLGPARACGTRSTSRPP